MTGFSAESSSRGTPILILMRHGSRDLTGLDRLTAEGREQAMRLTRDVQEKRLPRPTRLIATPRKRSQETLRFLADDLLLKTEIDANCDERQPGEPVPQFENRVRNWIQSDRLRATDPAEVTLVVSHLDWLESAVIFLESDESELEQSEPWTPAVRRVYFYQDGLWRRRKK
ncbi:MAG: histidine phosphatase family protein [Bdellovibrionaceae bacterium]|nr:histidine phosphatase family protein [Pseudobdellovibrionaceae bacterium]